MGQPTSEDQEWGYLPKKITIEKSLRLGFSATNNEAEYKALLMGMMMVQKMGGKTMKVFSD